MRIRYMTPADDKMAISRVYEESRKSAYKGIVPQAYLDSIPKGRWASGLDHPGRKTLVCTDGGAIVGTSSFCASRFAQFPGWGEIISIYLLPDFIGRGYGRALMDAALSELRGLGYESVFLWVLAENARARRFYERHGFLPTHDILEDVIGGKALREIRYVYQNG